MKLKLRTKTSITIDASSILVWKAMTTPALVRAYLKGTRVKSDWKEGSPISYEGVHKGKKFQDKGVIRRIKPAEILERTHWTPVSGTEDKPENYHLVTYTLRDAAGKTTVTLTQDNIQSEEEKEDATENCKMVLRELKRVVETC